MVEVSEIEITPEMIGAGLDVYAEMNPEVERASHIVAQIYQAMAQVKALTISPTVLLNSDRSGPTG